MPTLEFKGKQHIWAHHLTVPYRPLVPDPEKSVGEPAIDGNLIIHGDNLEGLKALLPATLGAWTASTLTRLTTPARRVGPTTTM